MRVLSVARAHNTEQVRRRFHTDSRENEELSGAIATNADIPPFSWRMRGKQKADVATTDPQNLNETSLSVSLRGIKGVKNKCKMRIIRGEGSME